LELVKIIIKVMEATVISVDKLATGSSDAVVKFSNGYQLLVRVIDEHEGRMIVYTPNHQLAAIGRDLSYKTLCEGVSIR
jgi:hypothetical protein